MELIDKLNNLTIISIDYDLIKMISRLENMNDSERRIYIKFIKKKIIKMMIDSCPTRRKVLKKMFIKLSKRSRL